MLRISGPHALKCLTACFRPIDPQENPNRTQSAQMIAGDFIDADIPIPCDMFLWPNEHSYTRQPTAELHTFGSPALLELMLEAICRNGARVAEPGEFTLRAFLAGRLDLTQAEAVLGVIDATNESSLNMALGQLAGGLSKPLGELREQLLNLLSHLEAGLDFVDEDISFISANEIERQLSSAQRLVAKTLAQLSSRDQAHDLPRVVIVGPPNAGKSSLFNALVEKFSPSPETSPAIVSEQAGTTRDFLVATVKFGDKTFELVDTAGVESDAQGLTIASQAQEMTASQQRQADCLIYCVDGCHINTGEAIAKLPFGEQASPTVLVATKSDLWGKPAENPFSRTLVAYSARAETGLTELMKAVAATLEPSQQEYTGVMTTAARCVDSLHQAHESIESALTLTQASGGEELIAADIRCALSELGRVVGAVYTDDVLDRIFSQFCIGK